MKAKRVLIYRFGSLGDTIVALPCFHLIRRQFPDAERRLLTNFPVNSKAPAAKLILNQTGLVQDYLEYSVSVKNIQKLFELRSQIQEWNPDVCVYITESRTFIKTWRDFLFFKSCGIKKIIGLPYSHHLRTNQWLEKEQRYESEAGRLLRCLSSLEKTPLSDRANWNLSLTLNEIKTAEECLHQLPTKQFFVCSVGTKRDANDWGQENWEKLIKNLSSNYSQYSLVLDGGKEDYERSERLASIWEGPTLNLCGKLTIREGAAILKNAVFFVGHNSGPMHLAAAVDVPCVAIFSGFRNPGVWSPNGEQHQIVYHQTECYDCGLHTCIKHQKKCITSITVEEVSESVKKIMKEGI